MNGRSLLFQPAYNARITKLERHADFRRVFHWEPALDGLTPLIGDSPATYSRATPSYRINSNGLLEQVSSGVLRIQDDGALLEPASTNYSSTSEDFTSHVLDGMTVTGNTTLAPDGTTTADTLTGTGSFSRAYKNTVWNPGAVLVSISIHVHKSSTTGLRLYAGAGIDAQFNLSAGTVSGGSGGTIRSRGDYWLCSVTGMHTGSGGIVPEYRMWNGSTDSFDTTGLVLILWGEVVALGYPTSYVKTSGSSASRAADVLSFTLSDRPSAHEDWCAMVRFKYLDTVSAGTHLRLMSSTTPRINIYHAGSGAYRSEVQGFTIDGSEVLIGGTLQDDEWVEQIYVSDADGSIAQTIGDDTGDTTASLAWSAVRDDIDEWGDNVVFEYVASSRPVIVQSVVVLKGTRTVSELRNYRRS